MNKAAIPPPSRCQRILPHLSMYLDGEIVDDALKQEVQKHLEECSACRLEIDALKTLGDQLHNLPVQTVSKDLRERIEVLARKQVGSHRDPLGFLLTRRTGMILGLTAVSFLVVSALGIWQWSTWDAEREGRSSARGDLIAFVDDYVAYVQSDSAPAVETRHPNEMEGWLAARLDFAPKLPRWSWAELKSGRLCFIHDRRVARVEYKAGDVDLTLFIQPLAERGIDGDEEARQMSSPKTQRLRGFEVACWRSSELDYVLVGPSSAADLFARLEIGRGK